MVGMALLGSKGPECTTMHETVCPKRAEWETPVAVLTLFRCMRQAMHAFISLVDLVCAFFTGSYLALFALGRSTSIAAACGSGRNSGINAGSGSIRT